MATQVFLVYGFDDGTEKPQYSEDQFIEYSNICNTGNFSLIPRFQFLIVAGN